MSRVRFVGVSISCCVLASFAFGQDADWEATGGPGGGEVVSLARVGDVVLAGAAGGMVRSADGASSWETVDDLGGLPAVVSMATIGERVVAADFFGGVFASDDAGGTWVDLGGPAPGESGVDLVADGGSLYLVTADVDAPFEGRLWRSADGGASWAPIELPSTPEGTYGAQSVMADGDLLLVGSAQPGAGGFFNEILRSEDGGGTWEAVSEGVPPIAISVAPIVGVDGTYFAGTAQGLIRSFDAGQSWGLCGGAGGIPGPPQVFDVAVSGGDVYFVGSKLDGGQAEVGPGLWRSGDLGDTWASVDDGLPVGYLGLTNALLADGDDLLVGGRFYTLYVSADGGASWAKSVDGISFADVYAMAAGDGVVYATPGGTNEVWRRVGGAWEAGAIPVEAGQSFGQVLELFANDAVFAGTQGEGIFRSADDGASWSAVNAGVPWYNGTAGLQRREIEAFAGGGETIYAGTGVGFEFFGGVFNISGGGALRSVDGGSSWTSINAGLPIIAFNSFGDPVFDPIRAMIEKDGTVLAGHFLSAGIFRTTNGGSSWSASNAGLPGGTRSVADFAAHAGAIYASGIFGAVGVVRSDDGGQSWSPAARGLPPGVEVSSLASVGGVLYAAVFFGDEAGAGVYATADGSSWSRVGEALDGVRVRRVVGRGDGRVFAGTFDRSAWVLGGCAADFDGDGALTILDFVAFQGAFVGGDPAADCDGSGSLDVLDFVCFQGLFVGGCR